MTEKRVFKLTQENARSRDSHLIVDTTLSEDSWDSFGAIDAPYIGASHGMWTVTIGHDAYNDIIPWELGYEGVSCNTLEQAIDMAKVLVKRYYGAELV